MTHPFLLLRSFFPDLTIKKKCGKEEKTTKTHIILVTFIKTIFLKVKTLKK
jgi:hypothetical protein